MQKRILVDANNPEEVRVVVCENDIVHEYDYENTTKKQIKGNIYLAKVTRVEPSLQAAFIDYGGEKHGFLPFSEIHPDYYQVPIADRQTSSEDNTRKDQDLTASADNTFSREDIRFQIRAITPPVFSTDEDREEPAELPTPNTINPEAPLEQTADESDVIGNLGTDEEAATSTFNGNIDPEETEDETIQPHHNLYKQYKIQEVIKRNQIMLVQVTKEERGNKGASFTTYISLAGRYCVLMPNTAGQGGVSRRINETDDRRRLKVTVDNLGIPEDTSVIIRTAGAGRNKAEIKRDYDYLVRLWNSIREHTLSATAPAFIHAEGDLIKRTIRDLYDNSTEEILIQGDKIYKAAKNFMKIIIPSHSGKVKQYKGKSPIFCRYRIEEQIALLYNPIVNLSSGSYIVMNQTEALMSIDVNSGKSTSERNIEETALKTNLEAAREIFRQLRLRDLSGLIVIDFIDMVEARNRRLVERLCRELVHHDRAKIQIGSISMFGLLEMSRQRLKPSFAEVNTHTCPSCNGKGTVRTLAANAEMIMRTVESEVSKGNFAGAINVYANPEVIIYILNSKRNELIALEQRCEMKVFFRSEAAPNPDSFSIEKADFIVTKENIPMSIEPEYGRLTEDKEGSEESDEISGNIDKTLEEDEDVIVTGEERPYHTELQQRRPFRHDSRSNSARRRNMGRKRIGKLSRKPHKNIDGYQDTGNRKRYNHRRDERSEYRNAPQDNQEKAAGSLLKGLWKKIVSGT